MHLSTVKHSECVTALFLVIFVSSSAQIHGF